MKRLLAATLGILLLAGGWTLARSSEEDKIEAVVAAVIEAYRTGDYEGMGRYYAEDVTMVPANYGPPLSGWQNVAERYQAAYSQMTGAEMIRENTLIKREGDIAWVVYQWTFAGLIGPQTYSAMGHTTLVLEKRGGDWKIVHNHTSALPIPAPEKKEPSTPTSNGPSS